MVSTAKKCCKKLSIIKAAEKLFKCDGFNKTSMEKIAEESGVSKQTIYSHFGSKACLFSKIFSRKPKEIDNTEISKSQSDLKKEAIISSACALFLKQGYMATSMDSIADAADVSKQTIYSYFGNKESLFTCIMGEKCSNNKKKFVEEYMHNPAEHTPREILLGVMCPFITFLLKPDSIRLLRVVISEAENNQDLAQTFMTNGPYKTIADFEAYLKIEHKNGRLNVPNPAQSSRFLATMITSHLHLKCMMDPSYMPSADVISTEVSFMVDVFLKAHAV